jgi:hypothetical protein
MPAGSFPVIRVFAWNVAEIASPVGNRHLPGGSFAFKYIIASGCQTANPNQPTVTSGTLLFEQVRFDLTQGSLPSHVASKPVAITFNLAASGTAISDMRLFLTDDSALKASVDEGLDPVIVQFAPSGSNWRYNLEMPSGIFSRLTTTIPTFQNVFRQDNVNGLLGEDDSNSSEFIYLNVIVPLGHPLGSYGVCGSGLLRFGLVFNFYSNAFALGFG